MKNFLKILASSFLVLALVFPCVSSALGATLDSRVEKQLKITFQSLVNQNISAFSDINGEWLITGVARSNYGVSNDIFESYYTDAVNTLKEKGGVISKNKYTEYSKAVIALTAIGKSPESVGGYNLLRYLADYNRVKYQGINGVVWALIALDSNNYSVPNNTDCQVVTTREMLTDYLVDRELKNGGWAIAGTTPDSDITAMTITALSKYYGSDSRVKGCVDRAISVLSDMQGESGAYISNGVENSESVAQVIVALCSMGINPHKDKRFVKGGNTLIDVLLKYTADEGFSHQKNGECNSMATEQCFYALVAYKRLCSGQNALFDMTEKEEEKNQTTTVKAENSKSDDKSNTVTTSHKAENKNSQRAETTTAVNSTTIEKSTNPIKKENESSTESKVEEINTAIKELKSKKSGKEDKSRIDKILEEYDSLSPREKKKVQGIEETKKAQKVLEEEDSPALPTVITVLLILAVGIAGVAIFMCRKRRKSKEEKQ